MIENSKKPIPVLVSGALGRMGSEVVNTVLNSTDCELVAAIDINEKNNGSNISELFKGIRSFNLIRQKRCFIVFSWFCKEDARFNVFV